MHRHTTPTQAFSFNRLSRVQTPTEESMECENAAPNHAQAWTPGEKLQIFLTYAGHPTYEEKINLYENNHLRLIHPCQRFLYLTEKRCAALHPMDPGWSYAALLEARCRWLSVASPSPERFGIGGADQNCAGVVAASVPEE
jgi:hypothetical protein